MVQTRSKRAKTVLALDLGSKTGWALRHGEQTTHGVWFFTPRRFEGGGMRYLRFRKQLEEVLDLVDTIGELYFEEVRGHKGTTAAQVYGGMLATLTAWCEERGIPYAGIHTGELKKHATGKGNASKEMMMKASHDAGWNPVDDNDCDALWILDFAASKFRA